MSLSGWAELLPSCYEFVNEIVGGLPFLGTRKRPGPGDASGPIVLEIGADLALTFQVFPRNATDELLYSKLVRKLCEPRFEISWHVIIII
jgi:hypothetical protein